ncbi:MAG: flagellar biosynthesis anti-sigma factor FlgM [Erythrobacter sp.]|nr:flagellar biosynthesis anti-sigma factor FlgM [Erythrobacter sp.]
MSLYDVSKLSGVLPVRGTTRELTGERSASHAETVDAPSDKGVAVQTGTRVSAGPVPTDDNRVAQIRAALRDGSYPIVPAKIADAMIAARIMLSDGQ